MTVNEAKAKSIRILVTGDRDDLDSRLPTELGYNGLPLEWVSIPVLTFERLRVDAELLQRLCDQPTDWIIFTSSRAVHFWTETLLEEGLDFPVETQVACIGERTAEVANGDGYTPDFYPTEPGSEKFLEEFEHLLSNNTVKPRILIPMAEGGRPLIATRLKELGCEVTVVPLYKTLPREDVGRSITAEEIRRLALIVFTSPSSVDAFTKHFAIPEDIQVACLGKFTSDHLLKKGVKNRILPDGNFERVGELL